MGGGVFPIYYNITIGGGGVYRDPKFLFRNKWTEGLVIAAKPFALPTFL